MIINALVPYLPCLPIKKEITDFGDKTFSGSYSFATSSPTRALSFQGSGNIIEYVEIMTTGNAVDFGDCHPNQSYTSACSNAHGGL